MPEPVRTIDPDVAVVFQDYPAQMRKKLMRLRKLVLETASEIDDIDDIDDVEETLKWGDPSYAVKKGSPIRIDWKESAPDQYAMYFNCRTTLVDTFRTLFPELAFEGSRALVFEADGEISTDAVCKCIELALTYHVTKRANRG